MKVLMVGLGAIGQRHVRNLRILLDSEVDIIAYRTRRLRHVLTDRLQIETRIDLETQYQIQAYEDVDQVIAQDPDVVFICNPSSPHIPVALSAAKAGRRPKCPYARFA
jgi:predicted dehydrogenase